MSKSRAQKKQRRRAADARASDAAATGRAPDSAAAPAEQTPARPAATPRPSRFEVRDGVARPRPVWAPFPLTEIGMAVGAAIFGAGLLADGSNASRLLTISVALLAIVVGELCLREHFGGFRSHTLLLAVLAVAILNGLAVLAFGDAVRGPPVLLLDLALAGALAWLLQRRFARAHDRAAESTQV